MDEHNELPDDFSQWSKNNWELFNLDSQNASYNDLRKAYSKLIKRFRPETHPEHFQRIQEAFETLRNLILSQNSSGQIKSPTDSESDSEKERQIQLRRFKRQMDYLNTLYTQYIYKADWTGAIKFLESSVITENSSKDIPEEIADLDELPYVYMFWLLYAINPSDEDNFPEIYKYLIMGDLLQDEGAMSLSIKTFFYFLERKGLSYKDKIYDYALSRLNFSSTLCLLNIRWLNLRFEDGFDDVDVILSDLEKLKERFKHKDLKCWARINIEAIEHLLWIGSSKAKKAIDDCMDAISEYPDYAEVFDEKFENIDQIEQLTASLDAIPKILPIDIDSLHTILLMNENAVPSRYRRFTLKIMSGLADDVLKTFMVFDYLNQHHSIIASRLLEPFHNVYITRREKNDPPAVEYAVGFINRLLQTWKRINYSFSSFRLPLLKILLEERLNPIDCFNCFSTYCDSVKDDPNKEQDALQIEALKNNLINDLSVFLTYYVVMSSEIDDMEDIDN